MKTKTPAPLITSPEQEVTPPEATSILSGWNGDQSPDGRDVSRHRVRGSIGDAGKPITINDLCEVADHYGIPVPASVHRTTDIKPIGVQASTAVGNDNNVVVYQSAKEKDSAFKECRKQNAAKDAELERLRGLIHGNRKID